ncbi:MAG: hypothetical protein QMD14_04210 [Candidatus Aenigmarchaeota archaeon]|nr:hypothetical protein [Candidatus Aenigmarchaeota archaeon]
MKENKEYLAYLGECYVQLELAKRRFKTFKMFNFSCDLIGENWAKIEIKSALPSWCRAYKEKVNKTYEYKHWQFRVTTEGQRESDFFICVPFESLDQPPLGFFIFPRGSLKTLGKSDIISVFESDIKGYFKKSNKENKFKYLNNWDLILKFKEETRQENLSTL